MYILKFMVKLIFMLAITTIMSFTLSSTLYAKDTKHIDMIMSGINKKVDKKQVEFQLKSLESMTSKQKEYLLQSYMYGSCNSDVGYGLAAICWQESSLGVKLKDPHDGAKARISYKGSYGPYHALLNTVMDRHHLSGSRNANIIKQQLINNPEYAKQEAILELNAWKKYWSDKKVHHVWAHAIASYNTGYRSINSTAGKEYLTSIVVKMAAIKQYFKNNNSVVQEYRMASNPENKLLYYYVKNVGVNTINS